MLLLFAKMPNYSVQRNSVLERFLDSITPKGINDCKIEFFVKETTLCTSPTFYVFYEDVSKEGVESLHFQRLRLVSSFAGPSCIVTIAILWSLQLGRRGGEYGNGRGGAVVTAMQRNFHRNSDRNEEKDGFMRRPKRVERERGGQSHNHWSTTKQLYKMGVF